MSSKSIFFGPNTNAFPKENGSNSPCDPNISRYFSSCGVSFTPSSGESYGSYGSHGSHGSREIGRSEIPTGATGATSSVANPFY